MAVSFVSQNPYLESGGGHLYELRYYADRAPTSIPTAAAPTAPPPGFAPVQSGGGGSPSPSPAPAAGFTPPPVSQPRQIGMQGRGMASYPMRFGEPNSQVIENPLAGFGSLADWEGDWQGRFNDLQGRLDSTPEFITRSHSSGGGGTWQNANNNPDLLSQASDSTFQWQSTGVNDAMGNPISDPFVFIPDPVQTWTTQEANPAFQALQGERQTLNQEREFFEPLFENQTARQQAYDNMAGTNAPNAVLPEGYTNPGFGQVSGQTNPYGPALGAGRAAMEGADDGISNDWLAGLYDPQNQRATGVYRPPNATGGLGGLGGMF